MTKILSALILTAFAFSAQAASHTGGAPMKDGAASAAAASAPAKKMKKMKKAKAAKADASASAGKM